MNQQIQDDAYILHKRNYRETSQILDLFTRQHGIVSVIAKGCRNQRSKFYSNLELLTRLNVVFGGSSELQTLISAEPVRAQSIHGTDNIFCAYYLNEIILRLLHRHDAHQDIFDEYANALQLLSTSEKTEPVLRYFEYHLLSALGYGIDLAVTNRGEPVEATRHYLVSPETGIIEASDKTNNPLVISGQTLLDFDHRKLWSPQSLNEAKRMMRHLLSYYLGDRPLKTRSLFMARTGASHA